MCTAPLSMRRASFHAFVSSPQKMLDDKPAPGALAMRIASSSVSYSKRPTRGAKASSRKIFIFSLPRSSTGCTTPRSRSKPGWPATIWAPPEMASSYSALTRSAEEVVKRARRRWSFASGAPAELRLADAVSRAPWLAKMAWTAVSNWARTDLWTMTLAVDMHTWPWLMRLPKLWSGRRGLAST